MGVFLSLSVCGSLYVYLSGVSSFFTENLNSTVVDIVWKYCFNRDIWENHVLLFIQCSYSHTKFSRRKLNIHDDNYSGKQGFKAFPCVPTRIGPFLLIVLSHKQKTYITLFDVLHLLIQYSNNLNFLMWCSIHRNVQSNNLSYVSMCHFAPLLFF